MKSMKYIIVTGVIAAGMYVGTLQLIPNTTQTIAGEEISKTEDVSEENTVEETEIIDSSSNENSLETFFSQSIEVTTAINGDTNANSIETKQKGYVIVEEKEGLRVYYNGKLQKKMYMTILKEKEQYRVVSPTNKKAFVYYLNRTGIGKKYTKNGIIKIHYKKKKSKRLCRKGKVYCGWYKKGENQYYYLSGKMAKGWQKIHKHYYYFSRNKKKEGQMQVNKIIYGDKAYYVDKSGVRVTSKDIRLAVAYVIKHTDRHSSAAQKMYTCYSYLWRNYSYQRFYGIPTAKDLPGYETDMLSYGSGNCFRFATTFAYLAKVLGYQSRVAVGNISAAAGGMTPHGWTEIKVDGYWYMCDPDMQKEIPSVNCYMKTAATYRYRHNCFHRYTISVNKGKVHWK